MTVPSADHHMNHYRSKCSTSNVKPLYPIISESTKASLFKSWGSTSAVRVSRSLFRDLGLIRTKKTKSIAVRPQWSHAICCLLPLSSSIKHCYPYMTMSWPLLTSIGVILSTGTVHINAKLFHLLLLFGSQRQHRVMSSPISPLRIDLRITDASMLKCLAFFPVRIDHSIGFSGRSKFLAAETSFYCIHGLMNCAIVMSWQVLNLNAVP